MRIAWLGLAVSSRTLAAGLDDLRFDAPPGQGGDASSTSAAGGTADCAMGFADCDGMPGCEVLRQYYQCKLRRRRQGLARAGTLRDADSPLWVGPRFAERHRMTSFSWGMGAVLVFSAVTLGSATMSSTALGGGAGGSGGGSSSGGGPTNCVEACDALWACMLQNNNCPGVMPSDEVMFETGCNLGCQQQPVLINLIDPSNCSGTIQTLSALSQGFAEFCQMGGGGAGGAGGSNEGGRNAGGAGGSNVGGSPSVGGGGGSSAGIGVAASVSSTTTGSGGSSTRADDDSDSSCACRTPATQREEHGWLALLLISAFAVRRARYTIG